MDERQNHKFKNMVLYQLDSNRNLPANADRRYILKGENRRCYLKCLKVCRDLLNHKEIVGKKKREAIKIGFDVGNWHDKIVDNIKRV